MARRSEEHATETFASVANEDAFLDALAAGTDPSGGKDPLATMLLELKADVDRPMPEPMLIDGAQTPTSATASTDEDSAGDNVVPLRRGIFGRRAGSGARRERKGPSPWVSGLIGAAAATAVVTGSGAALYNATPGSPLWGPATAVFGDRTAAVELAATLDKLEAANDSGDRDAAAALFEQARKLLESMEPRVNHGREGRSAETPTTTMRTKVSTVTVAPSKQPATSQDARPVIVTETVQPGQASEPAQSAPQTQPSAQPSGQQGTPVRPNPLESPTASVPATQGGGDTSGGADQQPQPAPEAPSAQHVPDDGGAVMRPAPEEAGPAAAPAATAQHGGSLGEAQNY